VIALWIVVEIILIKKLTMTKLSKKQLLLEEARDEFHQLRNDDEDFADQWSDKEKDFKEWFNDVYIPSIEEEKTKLFFVVMSKEYNPEIFETLEEAESYQDVCIKNDYKSWITITMVRNYYFDEDLKIWNYEDHSDTFNFIKELK